MRFDEIWMSQEQLIALAGLARRTSQAEGGGEVIEIGAHQGLSAIPLANDIYPDILHVVDHWQGSPDIPDHISQRDNYSIFRSNMEEATRGNYRVWKMGWRELAKFWAQPVRFLHIDAEHTAAEVADTIAFFRQFTQPGQAIIAGDDFNWPEVRQGVYQQFPATEVNVYLDKLWWVEI